MDEPTPDSELVESWRSGDEGAASILYERYLQKLLNLVGRHLARKFNPRLDPEDVVQSVFKSMFRRARSGDFQFEDDEEFWKLLLTMALNKVRNKVRYHQAGKRDPGKEVAAGGESTEEYIMQRLHRGPTAMESVVFADLFESVVTGLDEREQQLIHYRLEGYSQPEIAKRLGVDPRTVRRMFVRIREQVSDRFADDFPTGESGE